MQVDLATAGRSVSLSHIQVPSLNGKKNLGDGMADGQNGAYSAIININQTSNVDILFSGSPIDGLSKRVRSMSTLAEKSESKGREKKRNFTADEALFGSISMQDIEESKQLDSSLNEAQIGNFLAKHRESLSYNEFGDEIANIISNPKTAFIIIEDLVKEKEELKENEIILLETNNALNQRVLELADTNCNLEDDNNKLIIMLDHLKQNHNDLKVEYANLQLNSESLHHELNNAYIDMEQHQRQLSQTTDKLEKSNDKSKKLELENEQIKKVTHFLFYFIFFFFRPQKKTQKYC